MSVCWNNKNHSKFDAILKQNKEPPPFKHDFFLSNKRIYKKQTFKFKDAFAFSKVFRRQQKKAKHAKLFKFVESGIVKKPEDGSKKLSSGVAWLNLKVLKATIKIIK